MTQQMRIKGLVILASVLVCAYLVYPTVRWALYTPAEREELAGNPREQKLGKWREEELRLSDAGFGPRFAFSLKKWWQGDRDRVLNLGLDLQGGLFVVLEVQLDDAVRVQNQNIRELLKDTLMEKNIEYIRIADITADQIQLVFTNQAVAQQALTVIRADADYMNRLVLPEEARGPEFTVRLRGIYIENIKRKALEQARRVVENRVNELGLTEPSIQVQEPARVIVQLPGEKDPDRILRLMKQTAKLEFRLTATDTITKRVIDSIDRYKRIKDKLLVEQGRTEEGVPYTTYKISDADTDYFKMLLSDSNVLSRVPANYVVMLGRPVPEEGRGVFREFLLVERDVAIDGMSLTDAQVTVQDTAQNRIVSLSLDTKGGQRLKMISRKAASLYKNNSIVSRLAIVLDDVVYSSPLLLEYIPSNNAIIRGHFTEREAADLALVLRSGALPAKLEIVQNRTVGASLGADSIRRGVVSGMVGAAVVVAFMAGYYLLAGLVADFALFLNMLILLAVLAFFRATLTLPGIAGIILTVGMAVDANVLIFERIREELAAGKELRRAIKDGFGRAWITIVDSNLTTIATALILYFLGTGPIRGFGLTLMIGLLANLFTAVFVCRFIFDWMTLSGRLTSLRMFQLFAQPRLNVLKVRHICLAASLIVIIGGMTVFTVRYVNQNKALAAGKVQLGETLLEKPIKGIELTGGDVLRLKFKGLVSVGRIRSALAKVGLGDSMIQAVDAGDEVLIRSPFNTSVRAIQALQQHLSGESFEVTEEDRIGPAIGSELVTKAFYAIIVSLIVMVVYLTWRFEFQYGLGAMVALVHDVLVTLAFFALTGRQISLTVIAALLTIVGYSVNDTIVVFDRIREDRRLNKGLGMEDVINLAVNQTLSRTVLTAGTTLVVVLAQYLFGGEVINDFAFALLVGIAVGTYSSVFIASPVVLFWEKVFKRVAHRAR
ncbi:MAG: protein translocase subunit SecD [bacterium]|nr:protein translocase subunit SecD [bacterium]